MFSSFIVILAFSVFFGSNVAEVSAHGVITAVQGANGVTGTAFGVRTDVSRTASGVRELLPLS